VQSVTSYSGSGATNVVTPSNLARGSVIGVLQVGPKSSVQSIGLSGDGGSLTTALSLSSLTSLTSTGPLGDVSLTGTGAFNANLSAPSIFGSIDSHAGSITGTIQTTGVRIDPITGLTTSVPATLGRTFVTSSPFGAVLTSSFVHSGGTAGLSGTIVSRGDLVSQVIADGGITSTGVIAAQGNIGANFGSVRVGGIVANGALKGSVLSLGNIIGDVTVNGTNGQGLVGGRISAYGTILGNVKITGGIDGTSAILAAGLGALPSSYPVPSGFKPGSIGIKAAGTALSVSGAIAGIVSAQGAINTSGTINASGGYYAANDVLDAAAVDMIFSQGLVGLVSGQAPAFDVSGLDLANLTQILKNLRALVVKNGVLKDG
jgi:hypothetical protein